MAKKEHNGDLSAQEFFAFSIMIRTCHCNDHNSNYQGLGLG